MSRLLNCLLRRWAPPGAFAALLLVMNFAGMAAGRTEGGPISLSVKVTNPTCQYNNGSFIVTATGGAGGYVYVSDAASEAHVSGIFTNLAAGTYDIQVVDEVGTQANGTVTLTNISSRPTYSATSTDPTGCGTGDGVISITPIDGLAPYQYSIDDGVTFQSSAVFGNLGPGTYGVYIKDANGCITAPWSSDMTSYADFQHFSQATEVTLSGKACGLSLYPMYTAPQCGDVNKIQISGAIGGAPPYVYSLDGGSFATLTQGGFGNLSPGLHTVKVKDNSGLENSITYDFPANCPVSAIPQAQACSGTDGVVSVSGGNGLPPFSYSIDGLNFQSANVFTGLASAVYTVIVKDAYGATSAGQVTVQEGCSVVFYVKVNVTASACKTVEGSVVAIAANGAAPYSYEIDGGAPQSSGAFGGLAAGVHSVVATDANGQQATGTVSVPVTRVKVFAGDDTTVQVGSLLRLHAVDVDTSGFISYAWSPFSGLSDASVDDPVAKIGGDIVYTVVATTAAGCTAVDSIVLSAYTKSDILVPRAFTPNGDGHNDLLRAVTRGIREFKYIAVYSRLGQRVFYSANPAVGWDGTYGGRAMDMGAYVWEAMGVDYTGKVVERRGTVLMVR